MPPTTKTAWSAVGILSSEKTRLANNTISNGWLNFSYNISIRTHARTHAHTSTRARRDVRTHARTHANTLKLLQARMHVRTLARSHVHIKTHTSSQAFNSHARAHQHTRALAPFIPGIQNNSCARLVVLSTSDPAAMSWCCCPVSASLIQSRPCPRRHLVDLQRHLVDFPVVDSWTNTTALDANVTAITHLHYVLLNTPVNSCTRLTPSNSPYYHTHVLPYTRITYTRITYTRITYTHIIYTRIKYTRITYVLQVSVPCFPC